MILNLVLPRINPHMTNATIDVVHAGVGTAVAAGDKLIDLTIDLSAAAPHDCPPISHYRLLARDRVWLRRLDVAPGDQPETGAQIALFSTDPGEDPDAPPARQIRVSVAGIIRQPTWPEF